MSFRARDEPIIKCPTICFIEITFFAISTSYDTAENDWRAKTPLRVSRVPSGLKGPDALDSTQRFLVSPPVSARRRTSATRYLTVNSESRDIAVFVNEDVMLAIAFED